MSLLSGRRLMVIDAETTGWRVDDGHTVVEIARVTLEDGEMVENWSTLVRPARSVPAAAREVHGISDEMLAAAPEPITVAGFFREPCAGLPLVFHNAPFDLPFLNAFLVSCNQPPFDNPIIDTLGLAKGLFPSDSNALVAVAERLGVSVEGAHRALGDARTTARVLMALVPRWERERGIRSLAELAAASQDQLRLASRRSVPHTLEAGA